MRYLSGENQRSTLLTGTAPGKTSFRRRRTQKTDVASASAAVPGRSGTFTDVGIDSLGYIIGTALTIGIIFLIRFIKTKIDKKKAADN